MAFYESGLCGVQIVCAEFRMLMEIHTCTNKTDHISIRKSMNRTYPKYSGRQAYANSVDIDQNPQNAASDQSLHCLPLTQQF